MALSAETLRRHGIAGSPAQVERLLVAAIEALPEVGEAVAGFTPRELEALRAGGLDLAPTHAQEPDPLAETAARYAALLATSLTVTEAARRLGVDASRVRQRLAAHTLYGVKVAGGWRLPAFQFDGNRVLPGWDVVARALPADLHPLAVAAWAEQPDPDLEGDGQALSPRDWLRTGGDPAAIVPPEPQA